MPKKKKKGEDAADENPVFEVPADEKVFQGDPNDRKALLRHKQRVKARPLPVSPALGAYLGWEQHVQDSQDGQGCRWQTHRFNPAISQTATTKVALGEPPSCGPKLACKALHGACNGA